MVKVGLGEIVKLPAFEQAGDLFHQATGMIISFYDDSDSLVFYPTEKRCRLCQLVHSDPKGRQRCEESDKQAAKRALHTGEAVSYTCHAGLTDVVVPVVLGTKRIGCFHSGQSLLHAPTMATAADIRTRLADLDLEPSEVARAVLEVPVVDPAKFQMAVGLMSIVCNHLVESEIALRNERELTREQRKLRQVAEEKASLEKGLREMEQRLVQAQLNPHFLFNALNLMLGEAIMEGADRTSKLLQQLSRLLRNALTSIDSSVTLADEIASTEAYLDIFQARFEHGIELHTEVAPEYGTIQVPSLILQPLVENALVHALPHVPDKLRLRIAAQVTGDGVEISVCDNGPAVTGDELASLRRRLRNRSGEHKMTGLTGLQKRLEYYYGESAGLHLRSVSDGFEVSVRIPVSS